MLCKPPRPQARRAFEQLRRVRRRVVVPLDHRDAERRADQQGAGVGRMGREAELTVAAGEDPVWRDKQFAKGRIPKSGLINELAMSMRQTV